MAEKKISFEQAGNHWYWRGRDSQDCQTATRITMPEDGKITRVEFKIAGLTYTDPVYGYVNEQGRAAGAVWDASTNVLLTKSAIKVLPKAGVSGTTSYAPWVSFDVPDLTVKKGRALMVGFWRDSGSTAYSTQWPYNSAASGYTTYAHNSYGSTGGAFNFIKSETYSSRSLIFRVWYESGGSLKVFNGSSWRLGTVKIFDGTKWVPATVKVFDGTNWVEASS